MTIWALSDPHLSFGAPGKSMEAFGWKNYQERIKSAWEKEVSPDDLVLLPGDISWAMKLQDALIDLMWIDALPGTKLLLKGNHDYWWPTSQKLSSALPPSIKFVYNNAFKWKDVAIGGSRLWDTDEYHFDAFVEYAFNPMATKEPIDVEKSMEEDRKIFDRELERLKLSLSQMDPKAKFRIAMTHYPPIGADLRPSRASKILEDAGIEICVFGHLHNVRKGELPFGEARGVRYIFASCDYIDFNPVKIL
ncbi:MAG TPA: metallophosphoesterase [Rhabdochlamydiaceae bacterium]|nr:metallophosphoesterase [Rhabdochlamydiaceae bacterium]